MGTPINKLLNTNNNTNKEHGIKIIPGYTKINKEHGIKMTLGQTKDSKKK